MSGTHSRPSDGADPVTTPPPFCLAVHRAGDAVVVAISGELHAGTVENLDHILRDLISDQGNLHVVVDLSAVSDADTTGVAALVDAGCLAREHRATLELVDLPPTIERAMEQWPGGGIVTEGGPGGRFSGSSPAASEPEHPVGEGPAGSDRGGPPAPATAAPKDPAGLDDHVVEFYFREEHLAASVRDFLLPALLDGHAALVVATDDHRRRCDEELRAAGVDVDECRRRGSYVSLDAGEILASFMVDGLPDGPRFDATVGDVVRGLAAGCGGIRIFGEMVAVLWAEGNVAAAIALEDLWNSFRARQTFELLCAYPTWLFERDDATEPFQRICDQHTRVVPSERIPVEQGALRAIALLEQRVDAASAARRALEEQNDRLKEHLTHVEDVPPGRD